MLLSEAHIRTIIRLRRLQVRGLALALMYLIGRDLLMLIIGA